MTAELEINVNDSNFKQEVLDADIPVLVDLWAEWCAPCKMIVPVLNEIAREYSDKVKVCKLNVEEAPGLASQYGVMNIPTLLIFKNGENVDRIIGAVPKDAIASKLNATLA